MSELAGGKLFAVPFELERGDPERITRLLDHIAANPSWFSSGQTPEEARANAAWMLSDSSYWKYEMYSGGTFAGMLLLHNVVPKVDAQFHFTLLPAKETGVTLFGSRKLIWNFLGHVFDAFQLQRISVEIPAPQLKLIHWFRQRLGFRYEGEGNRERLIHSGGRVNLKAEGIATWVAMHGSRRERSHWDGKEWRDLILLRLLKSDYEAAALGSKPQAIREEPSSESSHVVKGSSGAVPADATAGASGGPPQATAPR